MVTYDNNSFKASLPTLIVQHMQVLDRQETEDLVIDLYYNQKKTFREVQKIVRKGPRDIKAILDKVEPGRSSSLSASSRAYQMFKEGNTPTDVAIALNLRQKEVSEYYREYWDLNGLYNLNQLYDETKDDVWSLVKLHKQMKAEDMNEHHVIRLLRVANNYLPNVMSEYERRQRELNSLEFEICNLSRTFQTFTDQISNLNKRKEECVSACVVQKLEIVKLQVKKIRQKAVTDWFEYNDEKYLKIKEIARQAVEDALEDRGIFFRTSLRSLIESLLMEPSRFYAYYFNTPALGTPSPGSRSIQDDKTRQDYEDLLIKEAERLCTKIAENITNEVITSLSDNVSSISSLPPQKHPSEENRNITQISGVYLHTKEELILESEELLRNSSEELPDVLNGQASEEDEYNNLDSSENDLITAGVICDIKSKAT